jgi:enamine deaminase RidA (YjgF/YER057c/UK114 family)
VSDNRVSENRVCDQPLPPPPPAQGDYQPAIAAAAGGLGRVRRCLRLTVFVACTDGFSQLSAVADGASAALGEHVGRDALPVRSALGVRALPGGAPVEVELTAAVAVGEQP